MERYIRPSCTVIFPAWAKTQPNDFNLEYLLDYAVNTGWQLTPAGWEKARELGVLAPLEQPSPSAVEKDWLKHSEAAKRLHERTLKSKSFANFKTLLTRMAAKGLLKTNGKSGRNLRFEPHSIDSLALSLRDSDLDSADDFDDDDE
jgi:hypothetical protein